LHIRSCSRKVFPQQIMNSVLFHTLSGQIDSSMHRPRSAAESANLMIEGSQIRLQNVNTLNPDSILAQLQPSSSPQPPASQNQRGRCFVRQMPDKGSASQLLDLAAESAKLMIEGSICQMQNVNTLNPDSILSQPAASQPAGIAVQL
jgi:hypothetical protein